MNRTGFEQMSSYPRFQPLGPWLTCEHTEVELKQSRHPSHTGVQIQLSFQK